MSEDRKLEELGFYPDMLAERNKRLNELLSHDDLKSRITGKNIPLDQFREFSLRIGFKVDLSGRI